MSAVFAQEMHQSKCGQNAELISPLRSVSIPAEGKVCQGGEDQGPHTHCSHECWSNPAVLTPGCLANKENSRRPKRKEITELNTSLEQAFSLLCHNISPFPYIRISTNTRSLRKQSTGRDEDLGPETSWLLRSVIPWHQPSRCPRQLWGIRTCWEEGAYWWTSGFEEFFLECKMCFFFFDPLDLSPMSSSRKKYHKSDYGYRAIVLVVQRVPLDSKDRLMLCVPSDKSTWEKENP